MVLNQPELTNLIAKKYDNVIFSCKYNEARPKPITTWEFNKKLIKKNDRKYSFEKYTLLLKNVTSSDIGKFLIYCV